MVKRTLGSFALLGLIASGPAAAATNSVFVGHVVHVSANNIKVADPNTNQTLSFLLVPHFKNVFSSDGKTTSQMSALRPGTPVTVIYDQKALGARHADRITINGSSKAMKS